jgi:hypothetical protein
MLNNNINRLKYQNSARPALPLKFAYFPKQVVIDLTNVILEGTIDIPAL